MIRESADILSDVKGIFLPSRLKEKYDQIDQFLGTGDSVFFAGDVDWTVMLPSEQKSFSGQSESLNNALKDMRSLLKHLLHTCDEYTKIKCSITTPLSGETS